VKRRAADHITLIRTLARGKSVLAQQAIQLELNGYETGVRTGLGDLEAHKKLYDDLLVSRSYSSIRYVVFLLAGDPDIMCSSLVYPEYDFNGSLLQDLGDFSRKLDLLTCSLVSTLSGGAIVFAWNGDSDESCRRFISSLSAMNDGEVTHAVVRFVFEHVENKFLAPKWWDNLDPSARETLLDRYRRATSTQLPRQNNCLVDDGVRAVQWQVRSRLSNALGRRVRRHSLPTERQTPACTPKAPKIDFRLDGAKKEFSVFSLTTSGRRRKKQWPRMKPHLPNRTRP